MGTSGPSNAQYLESKVGYAAIERTLNAPEAGAAIKPARLRRLLEAVALAKYWLLKSACSASWFDECWQTGAPYPPPADRTPMFACGCARCRADGTMWPALYVGDSYNGDDQVDTDAGHAGTRAVSYECHLESLPDWTLAQLPSSPSGMALRAIRQGRIKLRRQRTHLGKPRRARP